MTKYDPNKVSKFASISYEKPINSAPLNPVDEKRAKTAWSVLGGVLLLGSCAVMGSESTEDQRYADRVEQASPLTYKGTGREEIIEVGDAVCELMDDGATGSQILIGMTKSGHPAMATEYVRVILIAVEEKCPEYRDDLAREAEELNGGSEDSTYGGAI